MIITDKEQLNKVCKPCESIEEGEEKLLIDSIETVSEEDWPDNSNKRTMDSFTPDVVKDYDRDFDNAMEEMETKEMFNMKRGDPYAEGTD